jgi:hypothetical protein
MYANIRGSAIPQPIEMIPMLTVAKKTMYADIESGGTVYYSQYDIIQSRTENTIKVGESFTIKLIESSSTCTINYKNSSKLRVLVKDLKFIIACIENGYFVINGARMPFDSKKINLSNFDMNEQKERLNFATRAVQALDLLGSSSDIDMNTLSDEDIRNLQRLIVAFVDKKPVTGLKEDLPPVFMMKVGTLKFVLCCNRVNGRKNEYELLDFFKCEMKCAYDNDAGEKLETSQFELLHGKDFLEIENLNSDAFLPSFQNIKGNFEIYDRANWFLLDLLSAYDKSNGSRKDLLKSAYDFAEWLREEAGDKLDNCVKTLNFYQVIKREKDTLNIIEMTELWKLAIDPLVTDYCKVAVHLLLGQQETAEEYFEKLDTDERENLKGMPIFHFWNKEKNCNC